MNTLKDFLSLFGSLLQLGVGIGIVWFARKAKMKYKRGDYPDPQILWKIAIIMLVIVGWGMIIEAILYTIIECIRLFNALL